MTDRKYLTFQLKHLTNEHYKISIHEIMKKKDYINNRNELQDIHDKYIVVRSNINELESIVDQLNLEHALYGGDNLDGTDDEDDGDDDSNEVTLKAGSVHHEDHSAYNEHTYNLLKDKIRRKDVIKKDIVVIENEIIQLRKKIVMYSNDLKLSYDGSGGSSSTHGGGNNRNDDSSVVFHTSIDDGNDDNNATTATISPAAITDISISSKRMTEYSMEIRGLLLQALEDVSDYESSVMRLRAEYDVLDYEMNTIIDTSHSNDSITTTTLNRRSVDGIVAGSSSGSSSSSSQRTDVKRLSEGSSSNIITTTYNNNIRDNSNHHRHHSRDSIAIPDDVDNDDDGDNTIVIGSSPSNSNRDDSIITDILTTGTALSSDLCHDLRCGIDTLIALHNKSLVKYTIPTTTNTTLSPNDVIAAVGSSSSSSSSSSSTKNEIMSIQEVMNGEFDIHISTQLDCMLHFKWHFYTFACVVSSISNHHHHYCHHHLIRHHHHRHHYHHRHHHHHHHHYHHHHYHYRHHHHHYHHCHHHYYHRHHHHHHHDHHRHHHHHRPSEGDSYER